MINLSNNENVTVAMSNLGKVSFPSEVTPYVQGIYFHTSAIRPQFCMVSHEDCLTLSFTTPFIETDIQKKFVELLTEQSIEVIVGTNRVTKNMEAQKKMKQCIQCHAKVKGDWDLCPLCQVSLAEQKENAEENPGPFPVIPLRFNREKVTKLLSLVSVLVILTYFVIQWFWSFQIFGLDYVLYGIMSMWMVVFLIIISQASKHNQRNRLFNYIFVCN